ncbi:CHAP domain-containing protein [Pimelobacter simplex]|uniref:CHAP domain-containing protein n=1 Tax=Nocardioides simplex TaxID=2045 RepID=UPI00380C7FE6
MRLRGPGHRSVARWGTGVLASALVATFVVLAGPPAEHTARVAPSAGTTYLCAGYAPCIKAGYSDSGYGAVNGKMYWNMYSGHNCTNYVAYRMIKAGGPATRPWSGGGNASEWGKFLSSMTDQVPNVGAVAWWGRYSNGSGSAGHVAYVERVVSATEIIISEDSWGGTFHWRSITKSSGRWPTGFIHIVDKKVGATARPVVSGTPKVGVALKTTAGSWSGSPTGYAYQWLADGAAISGATATSYTPTAAVLGKKISVRVTASKKGATSGVQDSVATAAVAEGAFAQRAAPVVTGTLLLDNVVTATAGTWAPSPSTTVWRWFANGVRIPDNTTPRLPLTAALVGKRISVKVVAKQAGYANMVSPGYDVGQVLAGVIQPTTPAAVAGRPALGQVLTVTPATLTPTGTTVGYQWVRDGVPIPGATGTTYRLTAADVGRRVTAEMTATRPQYLPFHVMLPASTPVTSPAIFRLKTRSERGRAIVRVRVLAAGVSPVPGQVLIKVGRWSQTVKLDTKGVARVVVALPKGAKAVRVRYLGSTVVPAARTTGSVTVR